MAVSLRFEQRLDVGAAQPLFRTNISGGGNVTSGGFHHQYDISPEGDRFLIVTGAESDEAAFNVIVNWPATLNH